MSEGDQKTSSDSQQIQDSGDSLREAGGTEKRWGKNNNRYIHNA